MPDYKIVVDKRIDEPGYRWRLGGETGVLNDDDGRFLFKLVRAAIEGFGSEPDGAADKPDSVNQPKTAPMRYRLILSDVPSGQYAEFTCSSDDEAVAEAKSRADRHGSRVISLGEIRIGNPDTVRRIDHDTDSVKLVKDRLARDLTEAVNQRAAGAHPSTYLLGQLSEPGISWDDDFNLRAWDYDPTNPQEHIVVTEADLDDPGERGPRVDLDRNSSGDIFIGLTTFDESGRPIQTSVLVDPQRDGFPVEAIMRKRFETLRSLMPDCTFRDLLDKAPLGHRPATADEEADYFAGHELVHGAVETEHGLFVPIPDHPNLYDADTNERIGPASPEQVAASAAAAHNGGIIRVDRTTGELSETGRRVYTDGWES
jgi:hypothetical protein